MAPGEAIVGRDLASDLGLRVGDRLRLQTTGSTDAVRVTALVDLGVKELNRRTVIVPLRSAQNLLSLPGGATNVDLTVRDVWAAQTMADQLRRELPYPVSYTHLVTGQRGTSAGAESHPLDCQ